MILPDLFYHWYSLPMVEFMNLRIFYHWYSLPMVEFIFLPDIFYHWYSLPMVEFCRSCRNVKNSRHIKRKFRHFPCMIMISLLEPIMKTSKSS